MKETNILLNKQQRELFNQLLKLAKLKKAILAGQIDLAVSQFSEATSNGGTRPMAKAKWVLLRPALETGIAESFSKQYINQATYQQALTLLATLTQQVAGVVDHNGDSLTEFALNYVLRDGDGLLQQRFDNNTPYFWINGGVKKGKSSLLNQAKKQCERRGITYRLCNFKGLLTRHPGGAELSYQQVLQYLYCQVSGSKATFTATEFTQLRDEFEAAMRNWHDVDSVHNEVFFIAIDHLECLITADFCHQPDAQPFNPFTVIQYILQVCASLSRELNRVSFALVVEDYLFKTAAISSLMTQAARIPLRALSCDEIVNLWQKMQPSASPGTIKIEFAHAKIITERMGGNPLIIQCLFNAIINTADHKITLGGHIDQLLTAIDQASQALRGHSATMPVIADKSVTRDEPTTRYVASNIELLKRLATHTRFCDDVESISFDDLIGQLAVIEKTVLPPKIFTSLEHLGLIDERTNVLEPLIKVIIDAYLSGQKND